MDNKDYLRAKAFIFTSLKLVCFAGIWASFRDKEPWSALFFFLFAFLVVDTFDGYFARIWEVVSDFGAFWDAFCDKVVDVGTLFAIYHYYPSAWPFKNLPFNYFLTPLAVLEGYLVGARIYEWLAVRAGGSSMFNLHAGGFGKAKVWNLGIVVVLLFSRILLAADVPKGLVGTLSFFALALAVLSIIQHYKSS